MRRSRALYICYESIRDPLVTTQVVTYLREVVKDGVGIDLLTFEKTRLTEAERLEIRATLESYGIRWHVLRYHKRPSLPATLYDIVAGIFTGWRVCSRYGIPLVHARSHVAGAIALSLKCLARTRLLFDVRGLLADEYADVGHWRRNGLKYRLTKAVERVLFKKADAMVMLTNVIKMELVATERALRSRAADIEVIPCCVEAARFRSDREKRRVERCKKGWEGRRVLIYVGKLGSWYLVDEMAQFFEVTRQEDRRFFFQVLTQSDPSPMERALRSAGVPREAYDISHVPTEGVPLALCGADVGISFRAGGIGARSSSPTKVAEYLAAGLPVVSNRGVGDCDHLLRAPNLGVIVSGLDKEAYRQAARVLISVIDDPMTPAACRIFAERELSVERVGGPRYVSVYNRLLGRTEYSLEGGE